MRFHLHGLKHGKPVGLDNIPARLFVDSAGNVAKPLTAIINISLQSGVVIPTVSNVLERAVHHQLYAYLND